MNPWLIQLIVGSFGLALAALLAGFWLRLWKRDPLASYRMSVIVLLVTLCMPLAQWGAKRIDLPQELNFASAWAQRGLDWVSAQSNGTEVPLHAATERDSHFILTAHLRPGANESSGQLSEIDLLNQQAWDTDSRIAALKFEEQALLGNLDLGASIREAWYESPILADLNAMELGLGIYLIGLVCSLMHTGLRLKRTKNLLRDARPVTDHDSLALWQDLMKGSPLAGSVRLLESRHIRVPMCFGLGTPAVVLPPGGRGDLDADLFSCVLLHELVHLERRDTWVMLGQEFARSTFWFHPAAWWLCNKIDLLRELSCDLLVVRRTGRRKRYATALVEYAARMRDEFGPSQAQATALLPWSSSTHQLSRRIEMLVKLSAGKPGGSRRTMFLAAGSLFSVLWGGQLATAAAMAPAQEEQSELVDLTDLLDAIELEEGSARVEPKAVRLVEPAGEPGIIELIEPSDEPVELELLRVLGQGQNSGQREQLEILRALGYVDGNSTTQDDDKTILLGITIEQNENLPQVRILSVNKGSLAEKAGLKVNDIIININGDEASVGGLLEARKVLSDGKLKLKIMRGGDEIKVDVKADKSKHKGRVHTSDHGGSSFFVRRDDAHSHGQEGNVFTIDSDEVHTLPGKLKNVRIHRNEDGSTPDVFFVDENGEGHSFSGEGDHDFGFSWFSDSSDGQQDGLDEKHSHRVQRRHKQGKEELREYLVRVGDELVELHGVDRQELHEHLSKAQDALLYVKDFDFGDLQERLSHAQDTFFEVKDFDFGDLQKQLKKAKLYLGKEGDHSTTLRTLIEKSKNHVKHGSDDEQQFVFEFKNDGDSNLHFSEVDQDAVRLKIKDALKNHPESKSLHMALETLKSLKHPVVLPDGEHMEFRVHVKDGTHLKGDAFAKLHLGGQGGEWTMDDGDAQGLLRRIKQFTRVQKDDQNIDHSSFGNWTKPGEYSFIRRSDEDQCSECAAKDSGSGGIWKMRTKSSDDSDMKSELDRMRDLLKKRKAELSELEARLESLRHGAR